MYGRPLGSVFSESFCSTCANQTHLALYPDKYGNLELLFVCFDAVRPKSTAMVIAGRSVHLTTLFPGQA